jgi:hypothetical protein
MEIRTYADGEADIGFGFVCCVEVRGGGCTVYAYWHCFT